MKFDINQLAAAIEQACPEAVFAFLHGSARFGVVNPGSDLDIAVWVAGKPSLEIYQRLYDAAEAGVSNVEPDVGFLNQAEPIYRFEALKGHLLFCRDQDQYLDFFSKTCREYEFQIADYQRQHQYRLEAMNA